MGYQSSLFDGAPAPRPSSEGLLVLPHSGRPLTKAQKIFNRLVQEVERLRSRLDQDTGRYDAALAYYGEHLYPRWQRQNALRRDYIRALASFLDGPKRLKNKSGRKTLRRLIAEEINEIIVREGSLDDSDLRDLFERLNGVDFEQAKREGIEGMRAAFEDMLGDLGFDVDLSEVGPEMTEEAFAKKAAEWEEQFEKQLDAEIEEERNVGQRQHHKTKRQIEKEAQVQQAEEVRKKSIATIYKQLAKVLHPDLEQDPMLRERKVVLMQELTAAYREHDLHTLLRMELEWIQREQGDLVRLTDEKLKIYNQVLREQVETLRVELAELPYHPRYQPIAEADGFDFRLRTDGPAQAHLLDKLTASMEASLDRLRSDAVIDEVQNLLRDFRNKYEDLPF